MEIMKAKIEDSSGNVFQDLGLDNPEECLAKAEIASQICILIKKKKLSQSKFARVLGITQPKVSLLLSGKLKGFSLERLLWIFISANYHKNFTLKNLD